MTKTIQKLDDTWRRVRPQVEKLAPEPKKNGGGLTRKDVVTWTLVVAPLTTIGLALIHYIAEPSIQWTVRRVFPNFDMGDNLELAFASLFALWMARKWKY